MGSAKGEKDMTREKPIAALTVRGASDLTEEQREQLLDWLKAQVTQLEKHSANLSKVWNAKFWLRGS